MNRNPVRPFLWISALMVGVMALAADPAASDSASQLIAFRVLENEAKPTQSKRSLVIEVPLVKKRLPSKKELNEIAQHLVGTPKYEKTWVLFYLPGMEIGAGAYATAHYRPEPEGVRLVPFALLDTEYEHLDPDLADLTPRGAE